AGIRLTGSIRKPEADLTMDIQQPAAFGEKIDRLRADARYRAGELNVTNGIANDGPSELRFSGNYRHPENDLKSGDMSFDATTQSLMLSRIEQVAKLSVPLEGSVGGRMSGTGRIANGKFELTAATVNVSGQGITVDGE